MKAKNLTQICMICFLLITGCMLLTNCTQDDFTDEDIQSDITQETIRVNASMPGQDIDSRVSYDDATLQLHWEKGDTLLLVGYDINHQLIDYSKLCLVDGAGTSYGSFEGKAIKDAKFYLAYYKNANLNYDFSIENPSMNFSNQKQHGNNSTEHLRDNLDISSRWASADDVRNGNLRLRALSSVLKFDIENMPTTTSKLQRLACKTGNYVHTMNFENAVPTDHFTAYLGFSPWNWSLKAGDPFGVELFFTDGTSYYTEVISSHGKNYQPGKKYTAKIDNEFKWTQRDTSSQLLFKTKNNEPYSRRLPGFIIADDQTKEGYWVAVKDVISEYFDPSPIITTMPSFESYDEYCNLESIIIPSTVTNIPEVTFYCCTYLKTITIPNSVTEIGESAFTGCSSLSHFSGKFATKDGKYLISEDGTTVYAFAPKGMTSATVPNGVTSIMAETFALCEGLTQITLPASLKHIGLGAFGLCSNVHHIELPSGLKTIEEEAFALSGLTQVNIPQSVETILDGAFAGCSHLEKFSGKFATKDGNFLITEDNKLVGSIIKDKSTIVVPEGVQHIGMDCFMTSESLNKLVFPKTVTSFGEYPFSECPNLKEVFILSPTITLEDDYIFDQESTEKINLYLNVAMKNEVTEGNHWHVNWKSIVFVDENGKLVQ